VKVTWSLLVRSGQHAGVTRIGVKQQSRHLDRAGLTLLLRNASESVAPEP
jgi:hypothetical protein